MNCLEPEVICKATEHIPQQIEMVRSLEEKGFTYRIDDGLYFDVSRFPRYAELARLDLAGQEAGARIGDVEGKRNAADFALWKFAAEGVKRQQEWDSPWGRGFPGWRWRPWDRMGCRWWERCSAACSSWSACAPALERTD